MALADGHNARKQNVSGGTGSGLVHLTQDPDGEGV